MSDCVDFIVLLYPQCLDDNAGIVHGSSGGFSGASRGSGGVSARRGVVVDAVGDVDDAGGIDGGAAKGAAIGQTIDDLARRRHGGE